MSYVSTAPCLFCLVFLLTAGCAPNRTVVLVPDPDGQIGQAQVSTAGGTRHLTKANDMTRVSGPNSAPSPVTTASDAFVKQTFGEVLDVEPAPAQKFVLFFETGKAELAEESRSALPAMLEAIRSRKPLTVAISGHSDAAGSVTLNERLSLQRAEKIRDLLQQNGIPLERMTVSSHGKGVPLIPTADGVAEPRNRRVEVLIR